jgi:hypothetical protein
MIRVLLVQPIGGGGSSVVEEVEEVEEVV